LKNFESRFYTATLKIKIGDAIDLDLDEAGIKDASPGHFRGTLRLVHARNVESTKWVTNEDSLTRGFRNEVVMKIAIGIAALVCAATAFAAPATASWFHSNAKAQISGQVVDDRYGKPLEGIQVMAVPAGTTTVEGSTFSDKTGRFTLRGLRGGDYRLVFQRPGSGQAYADGISVRSDDHLVMISPFAVPSVAVAMIQELGMRAQCGKLLQPGQTADVYVVCSGY